MANVGTIRGDLVISGELKVGSLVVPNGSVGDAQHTTSDPLTAAKQYHRHEKSITQSGTATTATHFLGPRPAAGTVSISASSLTVAIGAATVGIVLKKNGSSIMSSALTLDNARWFGRLRSLGAEGERRRLS
jgi:hypothetical protein